MGTQAFLEEYSLKYGAEVARHLAELTRLEREGRVLSHLYECALSRFDGDPDREIKAAVTLLALGTAGLVGRHLDFSEMDPTEDRDWAELTAGRRYLERLGISAWSHRKVRWCVCDGEIVAEFDASPGLDPMQVHFWSGLSRYERERLIGAMYKSGNISLEQAGALLAEEERRSNV